MFYSFQNIADDKYVNLFFFVFFVVFFHFLLKIECNVLFISEYKTCHFI